MAGEADDWFDVDRTQREDAHEWDGHQHRSVATGRAGHYQELYRTAAGRRALGRHSDLEGDLPVRAYVTAPIAREWMIINFSGELISRLDEAARVRGVSRADVLRTAVEMWLESDS